MLNKYCLWVFVFKLMWEQFGKEKYCLIFKEFLNEVFIYFLFVKKYVCYNYIIFCNIFKVIYYDVCYWCKRYLIQ